MNIKKELSKIGLPQIHMRNKKECYFDTYRKRLIEITPEETIRQKTAKYFEETLGVPHNTIGLEVPLCAYVEKAKGRADIVIHEINEDGYYVALAVIECKSPDVVLTDRVYDQVIYYADTLGTEYIVVTNGLEIELAKFDKSQDKYIQMNRLLSYSEMISGSSFPVDCDEIKPVRLTANQLKNNAKLEKHNNENETDIYGANTPKALIGPIVNLYDCFMDTSHALPRRTSQLFEFVSDLGLRYMDYSNAGGGHYIGYYRSILIKDRFGDSQIISFSIFGTDANFRNENRTSYSSLVVSVDNYNKSHNSLQYNIDTYAELAGNILTLKHNGKISGKSSADLINYIRQQPSSIKLSGDKLFLGRIDATNLLYMDTKEVVDFVYTLIEYALLREQFRS